MGQNEAWAECCICFEQVPVSGLARMDCGAPMNVCLRCAERPRWACPSCGHPGYVVLGVLRCGNAGCQDTREFDPATGDARYA